MPTGPLFDHIDERLGGGEHCFPMVTVEKEVARYVMYPRMEVELVEIRRWGGGVRSELFELSFSRSLSREDLDRLNSTTFHTLRDLFAVHVHEHRATQKVRCSCS